MPRRANGTRSDQEKRKALCNEVQKILAEDLPYLPLWFNDVVSVHRRSLGNLDLRSTGNYNFLATLTANP
jgi:ABC-type transport system substrate-binding protein